MLGATHPHVKEQHGETYRHMLESRAQRLGVDANVIFHNRFVSHDELAEFLGAADIYITPYLKAEQITSGTLAYAVGCGKAVISTPYCYARELLADGRGILVPWRDAEAIAREVVGLLDDDEAHRAPAARRGVRARRWSGRSSRAATSSSFEQARAEHAERLRAGLAARTLAKRRPELPELNLAHVRLMTDDTGMLQHATFNIPRYSDGYCLDDNARALLLMTLVEDAGTEAPEVVRALASRYLAFVSHAFDETSGRFSNFMSYARTWHEELGSEDSHGRALWALGAVVGRSSDPGRQGLGGASSTRALPRRRRSRARAPGRTRCSASTSTCARSRATAASSVRAQLAAKLMDLFRERAAPTGPGSRIGSRTATLGCPRR